MNYNLRNKYLLTWFLFSLSFIITVYSNDFRFYYIDYYLSQSIIKVIFIFICTYIPWYLDKDEYNISRRYNNFLYIPSWKWLGDWLFPNSTLIYQTDLNKYLDEKNNGIRQTIFALHPHGIVSYGVWQLMSNINNMLTVFPQKKFHLAAKILFRLPILKEFLLASGVVDASKSTAHKILKSGSSMSLYPGGEREQLLTDVNQPIIVAKERYGFISLALQYGVPITPIYVFNEDQLYYAPKIFLPFRLWVVKKFQIALIFALGWCFSFLPYKMPLNMVVGTPIIVPNIPHPTQQELQHYLELYISSVKNLFDTYKDKYPHYKNKELIIM